MYMKVFRCYYTKGQIEVKCTAIVLASNEDEARAEIEKNTVWPIHSFKSESMEYVEAKIIENIELEYD